LPARSESDPVGAINDAEVGTKLWRPFRLLGVVPLRARSLTSTSAKVASNSGRFTETSLDMRDMDAAELTDDDSSEVLSRRLLARPID